MINHFKIFTTSFQTFEGELSEEKTILVVRRHWFVLFPLVFVVFIFFLFSISAYFLLKNIGLFSFSLFCFFLAIIFLFLWVGIFYNLMIYFLTCFILTNKRVIWSETKGFFQYERKEAQLNKIQDISIKIYGPFSAFLNFGNLEIQTAGTVSKFTFSNLPEPQKIKEKILKLTNENKAVII